MDLYELGYRRILYPLYESVLRRRGTLRYLSEYRRDQWRSREELEAIRWRKLLALLEHCHEHVPYYRERWKAAGIDWRDIRSMADFARLPLLTKDDIRANYERLVAAPWKGRTLRKATGGSSGQPLVFEYTRESDERRQAVSMRGYEWAGAVPGRRTVYVWGGAVGEVPRASRLKIALHHRLLRRKMLNSFLLTTTNIGEYLRDIDRYRPAVVVGYVAPLHLLARHVLEHRLRPWSPRTVITGAEPLHEFQRHDIEKAFGCPVFNTYGCREFMLIASECERREGLHLNIDHLAVELLDEAGATASSGRVVVTDLHNFGMPFVRYVNGDLATSLAGDCACGRKLPRLASVDGRVLDVIRTPDGRIVPGEFFPHLLKDVAGVERFQVKQDDRERLTIRIVRGPGFDPQAMRFMETEIRKVLGNAIQVRYDFVDDIPLTPAGKLRVTIGAPHEAS